MTEETDPAASTPELPGSPSGAPATPVTGGTVLPPVPAAGGRPPSNRWRDPRLLQAAAVVVIVALVGAVAVSLVASGGGGSDGSGTPTGGNGGTTAVTSSATRYTGTNLSAGVLGLLGYPAVPPAPGPAGTDSLAAVSALVTDPGTRQTCVDQLSGTPGVRALAIDVGYWNGKPAAVIVLPNENNPGQVDAWVVGQTCSDADNPFPYQYQRVTRPS